MHQQTIKSKERFYVRSLNLVREEFDRIEYSAAILNQLANYARKCGFDELPFDAESIHPDTIADSLFELIDTFAALKESHHELQTENERLNLIWNDQANIIRSHAEKIDQLTKEKQTWIEETSSSDEIADDLRQQVKELKGKVEALQSIREAQAATIHKLHSGEIDQLKQWKESHKRVEKQRDQNAKEAESWQNKALKQSDEINALKSQVKELERQKEVLTNNVHSANRGQDDWYKDSTGLAEKLRTVKATLEELKQTHPKNEIVMGAVERLEKVVV